MTTKEALLKELYENSPEAKSCRMLAIASNGKFVTDLGHGNPNAKVFFVGEAPGAEEAKKGIPFVGQAGDNLQENLQRIGLSRSDVWIGNVVRFRPTTGGGNKNRKPNRREIDACLPLLKKEIEIVDPDAIVPLGLVAFEALTNERCNMKDCAGKLTTYGKYKLLPTYHPASTIYNPELKEKISSDFDLIKKLCLE